jgi:hypothetical protein
MKLGTAIPAVAVLLLCATEALAADVPTTLVCTGNYQFRDAQGAWIDAQTQQLVLTMHGDRIVLDMPSPLSGTYRILSEKGGLIFFVPVGSTDVTRLQGNINRYDGGISIMEVDPSMQQQGKQHFSGSCTPRRPLF